MKGGIIKHENKFSDIDIDLGITTTLNTYTSDVCDYQTCNNDHVIYIIDLGMGNEVEFLDSKNNIGVKNEVQIYEIENGD